MLGERDCRMTPRMKATVHTHATAAPFSSSFSGVRTSALRRSSRILTCCSLSSDPHFTLHHPRNTSSCSIHCTRNCTIRPQPPSPFPPAKCWKKSCVTFSVQTSVSSTSRLMRVFAACESVVGLRSIELRDWLLCSPRSPTL